MFYGSLMSEKPDFQTPSDFITRCPLMAKGIFLATFETAESDFIVFSLQAMMSMSVFRHCCLVLLGKMLKTFGASRICQFLMG